MIHCSVREWRPFNIINRDGECCGLLGTMRNESFFKVKLDDRLQPFSGRATEAGEASGPQALFFCFGHGYRSSYSGVGTTQCLPYQAVHAYAIPHFT